MSDTETDTDATTVNTFTVTDQLERELIWDALETYRQGGGYDHPDAAASLDAMIERVQQTFSWMRS